MAAIFAQGCFKAPQDYAKAALVFQYGDSPEHYYQAFVWANNSFNLGDTSKRSLIAADLDRYLVKIGKKNYLEPNSQRIQKVCGALSR